MNCSTFVLWQNSDSYLSKMYDKKNIHYLVNSNGADNGASSSKLSKSDADGETPSSKPPVILNGDKLLWSTLSPAVKNSISVSAEGEV